MAGTSFDAATYAECAEMVARLYRALDLKDHDALAALFMPDAVWKRDAGDLNGRAAIEAYSRARDPNRVAVHLVSNLIVEAGERGPRTRYYMNAAIQRAGEPAVPLSVFDSQDEWVRTDAGLRVIAKTSRKLVTFNTL